MCLFFLLTVPLSLQGTSKIVSVAIYQNEPKLYIDKNGTARGIFVDLLNEIARLEQWEIDYIPFTWDEAISAVRNGEIDLLPDVALTAERQTMFDFTEMSVLSSWSQIYSGPRLRIYRLSDLDQKRITFLRESVQQENFKQLMAGYSYTYIPIPVESYDEAFQFVKEGYADAVITNRLFGETHFKEYKLKKTLIIFNPSSLYFATAKKSNADLLATIDQYLEKWMEKPNSIYYHIMSPYYEYVSDKFDRSAIWLLTLAGVMLLALVIWFLRRFHLKAIKNRKEIKALNRKLQEEKNKFKSYFDSAPYGVFVTNENGDFINVNPTAIKITGFSYQDLIKMSILDLIVENEQPSGKAHFEQVIKEGQASGMFHLVTKNGNNRYWLVDAVKIDKNHCLGFVSDVTENQKSLERIERFAKIFEISLNEIYVYDANTLKFTQVNAGACNNTGYTAEEFKTMTPLDIKKDISLENFNKMTEPLRTGQKDMVIFTTKNYRKDNTYYDVEVHLQLFKYENENLFTAIILDITDRLKAENELKKLKENLEHKVEKKTKQLKERIAELEHFHDVTIKREIRMKELSDELKKLKAGQS
jgi:PAS domain S-box-containing protein